MILLFTFSINQETGEAAFVGNIEPQVALQILQQLVIAEAIKRSEQDKSKQDKEVKRRSK